MPVLVTGAGTPIGLHAIRLLVAGGGEVRVFVGVDDPAEAAAAGADRTQGPLADRVAALRAAGCKVAVGDLVDEAHVETALEQVHTVLHLLGRPTDDPGAHLERTATVIGAAIGAGCRRLVLLSDLALDPTALDPTALDPTALDPTALDPTAPDPAVGGNAWLAALAEAEDMAAEAPMESVVLRAAAIHGEGDPQTAALATGALGADPPGAHWPVAAVDVAMAAVLADRERELDLDLHVVLALAGPQRLTTAAYARALAGAVPGVAPGAALPPHAVDLLHRTVERPATAVGGSGRAVADGVVRTGFPA